MIVRYNASVFTPAGWRGVTMTAEVVKTSEKMAKVVTILEIDGEEVKANMSRTGAKRQAYYGHGAAQKEIGKNKRLSACEIISK